MSSVTTPVLPTLEPYRRLALRLASSTGTSQSSSISLLEEIRDVCLTLSLCEQDYIIESEMQRLIEKITKYIRVNRELDERIEEIDENIGLLIRNSRLTMSMEALAEMKSMAISGSRRNKRSGEARKWTAFDITRFYQGRCSKLKCYSHLFYALQTQPRYLSRLLFAVPTFQVSSFFKNCIYSLFFCEPGEREIYLLCRLLQEALKEEVTHKITKANYIIDGDPMIITIALDCHRAHRQALFDLLQPVILDIVSLKEPFLCLDPVSLHKDRFNLTGADSLEDKNLQDISIEQALSDNQVRIQLAHNIPHIVKTCGRLIDTMVSPEFIDLIPFGLKYICKSLDSFLAEKLSSLNEPYGEEERIKVISNVIFTRWIRPCILFPEAYLTNMRENEKRTSLVSRRNLNGVYKILQAAVNGKRAFTFSPMVSQSTVMIEETAQLDSFLGQSWFQLKRLVDSICWVDDISDIFFFNEFSDEANLKPPSIMLCFQEIMESHAILHRYQNDIAPNESDPLDVEFRLLMEECGPPPQDIRTFLGCDSSYVENVGQDELMNTEVSLPLRCRAINDTDVTSNATIKVKQALLELIRQRPNCKDLNQVLFRKVEDEENACYVLYKNSINWVLPQELKKHSVIFSPLGNDLCTLLDFAIQNMRHTEARSFDEILVMITNDIINKLQYRNHRYAKMINLEETLNTLITKREHLQEISQCYEKYLNKCKASYRLSPVLERISTADGNDSKPCLSYSALKLKKKGILISMGDCKKSTLKRVKFELSPSSESTLSIELRILERDNEFGKIKLDFQYLLKLQYDGYNVVNLLGRVNMNVPHLLYLINSKFYLRKN
ncbi:ras GTPase-activating-like protein IQGAP3 [Tetranychus urticae]|uniref:Ras-GAP domain-containing protein n=1 Tax=Tetranychus urticae TaxID=32264 RepID=T1KLC3_TETUR|nr:ras GTPase-activating-like protein IQGAP3 [Tetranychus urticae]